MKNEKVEKMMLKKGEVDILRTQSFLKRKVCKKNKENLLGSSIADLFISEALSCLCYQSFCYEKLRLVLEAMTVARVDWNTEMGCLKVQLLEQHYKRHQEKKLAALNSLTLRRGSKECELQ